MKLFDWLFSSANIEPDDRPDRIILAEAMRQLASGRITNDQFELADIGNDDRAVDELFGFAYSFYNDMDEHKLRGPHRLSKLQRQIFARCVLFLRTDLPYEWSSDAKWLWARQRRGTSNLNQILFASISRKARDQKKKQERIEDILAKQELIDDRIWPFRTRREYNDALMNPTYLSGQQLAVNGE